MKDIILESFKPILTTMRFVGLYPSEKTTILMKLWTHVLYLAWIAVVLLTSVNFVLETNLDVQQTIFTQLFLIDGGAISLKLLLFLKNSHTIKKCINHFGGFRPKTKEEKTIVENCAKICKRLSRAYVFGLVINASIWILHPLLGKESKLFLDVWLPYDAMSGRFTFYLTFGYLAAPCYYAGICGILIDPLLGGLAFHARAQLKILKHVLQNIHSYAEEDTETDIQFESVAKVLKRCVKHHSDILMFVVEYENCFSWLVFCQFAASTLGLCFCCIGIQQDGLKTTDIAMYVTSYVVMIFQIFIYCLYGTLLYEENESLNEAIYMGIWYNCDNKIRKNLILIMERSKRPMLITAGKIVPLTLRTFTSVLKTSYSLIAVLNRYQ